MSALQVLAALAFSGVLVIAAWIGLVEVTRRWHRLTRRQRAQRWAQQRAQAWQDRRQEGRP